MSQSLLEQAMAHQNRSRNFNSITTESLVHIVAIVKALSKSLTDGGVGCFGVLCRSRDSETGLSCPTLFLQGLAHLVFEPGESLIATCLLPSIASLCAGLLDPRFLQTVCETIVSRTPTSTSVGHRISLDYALFVEGGLSALQALVRLPDISGVVDKYFWLQIVDSLPRLSALPAVSQLPIFVAVTSTLSYLFDSPPGGCCQDSVSRPHGPMGPAPNHSLASDPAELVSKTWDVLQVLCRQESPCAFTVLHLLDKWISQGPLAHALCSLDRAGLSLIVAYFAQLPAAQPLPYVEPQPRRTASATHDPDTSTTVSHESRWLFRLAESLLQHASEPVTAAFLVDFSQCLAGGCVALSSTVAVSGPVSGHASREAFAQLLNWPPLYLMMDLMAKLARVTACAKALCTVPGFLLLLATLPSPCDDGQKPPASVHMNVNGSSQRAESAMSLASGCTDLGPPRTRSSPRASGSSRHRVASESFGGLGRAAASPLSVLKLNLFVALAQHCRSSSDVLNSFEASSNEIDTLLVKCLAQPISPCITRLALQVLANLLQQSPILRKRMLSSARPVLVTLLQNDNCEVHSLAALCLALLIRGPPLVVEQSADMLSCLEKRLTCALEYQCVGCCLGSVILLIELLRDDAGRVINNSLPQVIGRALLDCYEKVLCQRMQQKPASRMAEICYLGLLVVVLQLCCSPDLCCRLRSPLLIKMLEIQKAHSQRAPLLQAQLAANDAPFLNLAEQHLADALDGWILSNSHAVEVDSDSIKGIKGKTTCDSVETNG